MRHVGRLGRLLGSILVTLAAVVPQVYASSLENEACRLVLDKHGSVTECFFHHPGGWEPVSMRQDEYAGPAWVIKGKTVTLKQDADDSSSYSGHAGQLHVTLRYSLAGTRLAVRAAIQNTGKEPAEKLQAGLRLGVDTYMEKYPDWNDRYFPTLLRCERTHFWGYLMTPRGRILTVGSPDPVASWHMDYRQGLHRIYTATLDLLHPGPLPARHPQGLDTLAPGEERSWTLYFEPVESLDTVKPRLAESLGVPMIDGDRYTVEPGGETNLTVLGGEPKKEAYRPGERPGQYTYTVEANGKTAEAMFSVRHPWSWYVRTARAEAVNKPAKASSHTESWYGMFSAFLAREYFPDPAIDAQVEQKFQEIFPLMYSPKDGLPVTMPDRVQNHACMGGLLAQRYRVTGDVHDLECAAALADFIIDRQAPDGSYRSGKSYGGTHYTSVVYLGKSIMEVMAGERKLAADHPEWKERYLRHYDSVRRAMDELAKSLDNIQTEGELTYEDGMISCSYTQLAMFALLQDDPAARQKYLDAALYLANGHRCLSQIIVPDSRMNGGSLRFWESQYDILAKSSMLSSPHGWSAWRIYGLWYLYLLTGQEDYLRQVMNALGSCVQVIDADSGELRWGFVPDPYVEADVFAQVPDRPGVGRWERRVVGEQYMPMISGWFHAKPNTLVTGYWGTTDEDHQDGGCCDNDVHEIFKCLGEVALTSAYVLERGDGTFVTWNCTANTGVDGRVTIIPAEDVVSRIHLNLRSAKTIEARFQGHGSVEGEFAGLQWVGPGGVPDTLVALR